MRVMNPSFFGNQGPFLSGALPLAGQPRPRAAMGQQQSEALQAAQAELARAKGIVDRISATYNQLGRATNPEDARQAYDEAVASLERARRTVEDLSSLAR